MLGHTGIRRTGRPQVTPHAEAQEGSNHLLWNPDAQAGRSNRQGSQLFAAFSMFLRFYHKQFIENVKIVIAENICTIFSLRNGEHFGIW